MQFNCKQADRWLGRHCLQHLVAIVAWLPPRFSGISPSMLGMHPPPNRQCLADLTRHGWISYHFLVPRKSKIKRSAKSTEKSMKSPGSLLGARHLDRYKTMYPRVSVMTLQSPHHAAREKTSWLVHRILQWQIWNSMNTCRIYRLIIYIKIMYINIYIIYYYTINLNLQIVFCILSNGSLCYRVAILIKPFYGALHVTRVMYPVSNTD